MRGCALKGMGVAAIPRILVEADLVDGTLVALDVEWPLMAPGLHAVWPGNSTKSSLAALFVNYLSERFGQRRPRHSE